MPHSKRCLSACAVVIGWAMACSLHPDSLAGTPSPGASEIPHRAEFRVEAAPPLRDPEDGSPNGEAMESHALARRGSPVAPCAVADFDPRCRYSTNAVFDPPLPDVAGDGTAYFDLPIPKHIHQIWFGGLGRLIRQDPSTWAQTAASFGWSYRMWTEDDLVQIHQFLPARARDLLEQLLAQREYHAASDLLRVHLLREFGGLYVDVDIAPPQHQGRYIDPARAFPMRNVVMMTERWCRNVGSDTALMVGNGFIMGAPNHPFFEQLATALVDNVDVMRRRGTFDAAFTTGPFFVSRTLAGAMTIVPQRYMRVLKMFLFDEDYPADPHRGRSTAP